MYYGPVQFNIDESFDSITAINFCLDLRFHILMHKCEYNC